MTARLLALTAAALLALPLWWQLGSAIERPPSLAGTASKAAPQEVPERAFTALLSRPEPER